MFRRAWTGPLVLILAGLLVSPGSALAAEPGGGKGQPDIVVVMLDDMGAIDDRVFSRLPNIRELWLDGGLQFGEYFNETPLCCPARANFLTGQHTRRHGVTTNAGSVRRVLDHTRTLATALQAVGYHTIMAGKHLNGMAVIDPQPPGWDRVAMLSSWTDQDSTYVVEGELTQNAGYRDRYSGERAADWLAGAPAGRPAFVWYAPHAPHKHLSTDKPWYPSVETRYAADSRCSGISPWKPPSYRLNAKPNGFPLKRVCRSLLTVDEMVGRLRLAAEERGRPTIWVFTSDNGMAWGAHGYSLKRVPWADRVPLFVTGPGVRRGTTAALLSSIDLGPTLAELAGADMPWADGRSYAGLLATEGAGRATVFQDYPAYPADNGKVPPWWAVRQPKWRLLDFKGTKRLFNVARDPWELTDLAARRPDKVAELTRLYDEWTATLPPPPTK